MKVITSFNIAAKQFLTHGNSNGLMKLECKVDSAATPSGATTLFLQIHDTQTTAAEGAAPIKSWPVVADSDVYKEFKRGELQVNNGCYVCISTTEATKTLGTGSNKMSMVSGEFFEADETVTVAGDNTSAVNALAVWLEAVGPNRLRKVQITSSLGADAWAHILATDASTFDGLRVHSVLDGATVVLNFGELGVDIKSQDSDHTNRIGCKIVMSSSATAISAVTASFTIRAEYV